MSKILVTGGSGFLGRRIVSALKEAGHLVFAPRSAAYPGGLIGEMKESQIFSGRCHESVEGYGFSKRAHLVLMAAAHQQYGISCNQIALSNLYGEDDVFDDYRSHAAALMRKIANAKLNGGRAIAWGSGKPLRQLLYVGDAAEIIARAVEFPHDNEPINALGEEVSIRRLAETIADAADFPREQIDWDNSKPDGAFQKSVSGEKLRTLLPDFSPLPFADGITRTVHWYLQNKEEADRRQ